MASNYPGSLDSFDTIASDKKTSDSVGGRTHRAMHNDLGDAIEAVQTELGTDPAGASATVKARFDAIEANDWVTSARIAADAVGSSEIAANAVGTAEIADGVVTAAKLGTDAFFGNLLTANQASGTDTLGDTTGFAVWGGATFARSTAQAAQGAGSLLITFDGSSAGDVCTLRSSAAVMPAVTAGDIVTVAAKMRQNVGTRNGRLFLAFYDEAASVVGYSSVVTATLSTSWTQVTGTHVVPAGATRAVVVIGTTASGSASDSVFADAFSLHRGVGGEWGLPGSLITGQGPVLISPDGSRFVLSVDNAGALSTVEL